MEIAYNIVKYPTNKKLRQLNRGGQMLRENDIKNVRELFNRHHYVMTTAEL